jgi:hypothetical protein
MVQAPQHRIPHNPLATRYRTTRIRILRVGDALVDSQVWSCAIEVGHIVIDEPIQLALTQNEDVLDSFPSHTADEP